MKSSTRRRESGEPALAYVAKRKSSLNWQVGETGRSEVRRGKREKVA